MFLGPRYAPGVDVGTLHPFALLDADPAGRWVAACQAREDTNRDGKIEVRFYPDPGVYGDRFAPWLIRPGTPDEPLDAWLGADPSGRWIGTIRDGVVRLRDTRTGVEVTLDADARDDVHPFLGHRAMEFDPAGERLLYLRDGAIVVRVLASGAETTRPVPGVWRAQFVPGGYLRVTLVEADTNGDGEVWGPGPRGYGAPWTCLQALPAPPDGDMEREVLLAPDGQVLPTRDVAAVLPAGLVHRLPGGALTRPDGAAWTDRACLGQLIASWEANAVVSCAGRQGALVFIGPEGPRELGVAAYGGWGREGRFADLGDHVVDVATGRVQTADLLGQHLGRALLDQGGQLAVWDGAADIVTPLGAYPGQWPGAHAQGAIVAVTGRSMGDRILDPVGTVIVDLSGPKVLGRVDGQVVAVATDGRALVLTAPEARDLPPVGPARLVAPR